MVLVPALQRDATGRDPLMKALQARRVTFGRRARCGRWGSSFMQSLWDGSHSSPNYPESGWRSRALA
jgi:hypothetical protein